MKDLEEQIEQERHAHMDKEVDIISAQYDGGTIWTSVWRATVSFVMAIFITGCCVYYYLNQGERYGQET